MKIEKIEEIGYTTDFYHAVDKMNEVINALNNLQPREECPCYCYECTENRHCNNTKCLGEKSKEECSCKIGQKGFPQGVDLCCSIHGEVKQEPKNIHEVLCLGTDKTGYSIEIQGVIADFDTKYKTIRIFPKQEPILSEKEIEELKNNWKIAKAKWKYRIENEDEYNEGEMEFTTRWWIKTLTNNV